MQIIIFITSFFIFLFALYKFVKDDHVFLRKNIKLEEIFDVAFVVAILGLTFTQIFSQNSFSLPQGVIGGALGLLLMGKYRKFPLGRLFDFFTLSFLTALPIGFLIAAAFFGKIAVLYLFYAFMYLFLAIFFIKIFLPRIMNRTIKEGRLSVYFLLFFSLSSLLVSVFYPEGHFIFWSTESISLILLFVLSIVLLVKLILSRS